MNFSRYIKDVERLSAKGELLYISLAVSSAPEQKEYLIKKLNWSEKDINDLPNFEIEYQSWYSEAYACIKQLMPDRINDFSEYYSPSKARKDILSSNYTISDALKGTTVTRGPYKDKVVGPDAAIPVMRQQVNIVSALKKRFDSSLFDIQALVQADLFDNELHAAEELNKKGFHRGAGAMAGVVLEGHLRTVCTQHKVTAPKNATLGKLNDSLKAADVLDVPTWRSIQHLIDIRNLCDHKTGKDPTKEQIIDLISGVRKITKTIF